jgi:hypothetical protein
MAHSGLVPRHLHLGGSILDVTVVKVVVGSGPLVVGVVLQPHLAEVAVGTVLREKMTAAIGTMIDVTATVLEARMIETGR